jgi:hypothetical protein
MEQKIKDMNASAPSLENFSEGAKKLGTNNFPSSWSRVGSKDACN